MDSSFSSQQFLDDRFPFSSSLTSISKNVELGYPGKTFRLIPQPPFLRPVSVLNKLSERKLSIFWNTYIVFRTVLCSKLCFLEIFSWLMTCLDCVRIKDEEKKPLAVTFVFPKSQNNCLLIMSCGSQVFKLASQMI